MARKPKSWEVSDQFWVLVEPLIPKPRRNPEKVYKRKPGGGRKPLEPRKVFSAIVYVLRTGIQWKALPKELFGSASSIHAYFRAWEKAGVFLALWQKGLAEYDEMEGIAWEWQSIDGAMVRAALGAGKRRTESHGQGGKWIEMPSSGGRAWRPAIDRRNWSQPA